MVYSCNRILYMIEKDKSHRHHAKQKKPDRKNNYYMIPFRISKTGKTNLWKQRSE